MKIQLGKIYREIDTGYDNSFVVVTEIEELNGIDTICTLFRLCNPENPYNEYLDILENKLYEYEVREL